MASDPLPQPRHLTLVELAVNYGLFGGAGYWVAGATGAWIGAGLVTARYAYLIWLAARTPGARPAAGTADDPEPSPSQDLGGMQ